MAASTGVCWAARCSATRRGCVGSRAVGDITGLIRHTFEEWRATLPAHQPVVMEAVNLT